ncbi:MAG: energy-coupling factor ABC transporter substrate-binding protein [Bacillota bacterium]
MRSISSGFRTRINIVLLALVIIFAVTPLLTLRDAEFSGADTQARELVNEVAPDYQPWSEPFWEPPSGEIESLFFALQAAIGAGFISYYIGYKRGIRKAEKKISAAS